MRPEVLCPLSVDRGVWPTACETEFNELSQNHILSLPGRLADVLEAVQIVGSQRCNVIGITLHGDESDNKRITRSFGTIQATTPQRAHSEWEFAGYDVADRYLTSGISNCGYNPAEWAVLRTRWSALLNGHNLFKEFQPCRECLDEIEALVKEHSPFFVFGIWLIDSDDGESRVSG